MDNNFSSIESENKEESLSSKQIILFKKVSMVDKYNFFEYLAVMIDGGVSITEALDSVENKISSPYFKEKVKELITYISSGDSFSKSMKKMPDVFTASEISIVEAGETTGKLVFALSKLSDDLKKIYNLRKKVKGALTYPLIIFLFLLAAVGIVLIYVIPAIIPMFENASVELPMATKSLIATSDFVINNFAFIVLFFITLFVLFV
jgi:type IV pilus assembly protein PilC|tara:strand:+ start:826 stop:1443 length:618 start_codon:yes stop_codon:yes gene_type:complete